jgi:hypothetical protein
MTGLDASPLPPPPDDWWHSKRTWFDILSFALIVIPLLSAYVLNAPWIGERTATEVSGALALLNAVVNGALRYWWKAGA